MKVDTVQEGIAAIVLVEMWRKLLLHDSLINLIKASNPHDEPQAVFKRVVSAALVEMQKDMEGL